MYMYMYIHTVDEGFNEKNALRLQLKGLREWVVFDLDQFIC